MSLLLTYLNYVFILLLVVVLFNILIVVHELGHFLAARWRGLVVEKFAIWFGKPIWSKKIGGVEYLLGSIPAGGYVALPQMAPMETVEGSTNEPRENLPEVKPIDKIIVAFAGPLFSFGLAVVFAIIVSFVGRPVNAMQQSLTVGWLKPDGGAMVAGLLPGDKIIEVDGSKVDKFFGMGSSVQWQVISSEGETIPFLIERSGEQMKIDVKPTVESKEFWERGGLRSTGASPALETIKIGLVMKGSPAAQAGLKVGDQVTHLFGQPLLSFYAIGSFMEDNPGQPVVLTVLRNGQSFDVAITPQIPISPPGMEDPALGLRWDTGLKLVYPSVWEQIVGSVMTIGETLSAVFSPASNVNASHLSGPVGIMNLFAMLFHSPEGWRAVLWLSVVINVNLAIFNLLPIPVLDGGHITLAILEMIRRKPLSMRILEPVQVGFALLLFGFIIYVTAFDVQDVAKNMTASPSEIQFAPPDSNAKASTP